jgi:hypothetical protein
LENIEILVLGGIPKIPKLFDFRLILADYGNFQQPCTASSRFWQFSEAWIGFGRFWQFTAGLDRFWQILLDLDMADRSFLGGLKT